MRIHILIIIFIISVIPAYSETIKIAYFQSAPWAFKDEVSGKIRGATYEFIKEHIEPLMGVRFEWSKIPIPIARQLKMLAKGNIDASAMFAKNSERAKLFAYPDKPYFISHPTLVVTKNRSLKKINSAKDLYNLSIGFCGKSYISPFMRDRNIKWDLLYSSTCIEQNLRRVVAEHIDAQYQPSEVGLLYYARVYGLEDKIKLVQLPEEVKVYVPFSKKAAKKYMKSFNSAMEKSGGIKTFMKYLAKYIDISKLRS